MDLEDLGADSNKGSELISGIRGNELSRIPY